MATAATPIHVLHITPTASASPAVSACIRDALAQAAAGEQIRSCSAEAALQLLTSAGGSHFEAIVVEAPPISDGIQAAQSVAPASQTGFSRPSASSSAAAASAADPFLSLLRMLSSHAPLSFLVVLTADARASEAAAWRWSCFESGGVHMMCSVAQASELTRAMQTLARIEAGRVCNDQSGFDCPMCRHTRLSEDALHAHCTLFHANSVQSSRLLCPICRRADDNFLVHFHNEHGPQGRGEGQTKQTMNAAGVSWTQPLLRSLTAFSAGLLSLFRLSVPNEYGPPSALHAFALVVVRRPTDGKFLMVQEFASSGWWLPGGRVESGEPLTEAAVRETREEAGVDIQLRGILRLEYYSSMPRSAKHSHSSYASTRIRVIFYAEPLHSAAAPKAVPDYESAGASWIGVEELPSLVLRGSEPAKWFPYVANGGDIYPLSLLRDGKPC